MSLDTAVLAATGGPLTDDRKSSDSIWCSNNQATLYFSIQGWKRNAQVSIQKQGDGEAIGMRQAMARAGKSQ
jgi:hypothetical protein